MIFRVNGFIKILPILKIKQKKLIIKSKQKPTLQKNVTQFTLRNTVGKGKKTN
jgi:hypothetical protein